jgi:uncharacterized protein
VYGREHPHSSQFIIGTYKGDGEFWFDKDKVHSHFNRTVDRIPYCKECFCKWHCAGDCSVKTFLDGLHYDPGVGNRCYINQSLKKYFILEKIKEHGGVIWTGN